MPISLLERFIRSPKRLDRLRGARCPLFSGYWGLFLWAKRLGREANYSAVSSATLHISARPLLNVSE